MKKIITFLFLLLAVLGFNTAWSQNTGEKKIPYGDNPETGKYFMSGDAKLYFEVYGKGEPLLLLHGGVYGYIDEFEYLIPKLAETHLVICLATRGHGKSEIGHSPFTYTQRAGDAAGLLKHLNIEKAVVVGFSDGGYSAYKLASLYPEKVTRLIVMGAGDMKRAKREVANYTEERLIKEAGDYFNGRKKLMPEPKRWNESLKMISDLYNKDVISEETFSLIKCPTLVMAGDADNYSNAESILSAFRQISNAQLSIIPGCGHVILYCNFPAVWESMQPFVKNGAAK